MGFSAVVETDSWDRLGVLSTNGQPVGKAILSFLTALSAYCHGTQEALMARWFTELEAQLGEPICLVVQPLIRSFYAGDWNYSEDDYQWFVRRTGSATITEKEFRESVRQVREKWVDARSLLISVDKLVQSLAGSELHAAWWYEPGETETQFQSLSQTLTLVVRREVDRARIWFV